MQDEKIKLEKEKADLSFDLKRATTAKEHAEAAAKAATANAEQRLQDLLHQLDDAKHSTEAASTTSEFVRKVWCSLPLLHSCSCSRLVGETAATAIASADIIR